MPVLVAAGVIVHRHFDDSDRNYLGAQGWPSNGQASFLFDGVQQSSPDQHATPIASLAKVMTAYLVLRALPLRRGFDGPSLRVTNSDVADTEARRGEQQSLIAVRHGERLSERQALMALLLPSANNVAVMLARMAAGSVARFVRRMNTVAAALGMQSTRYTDPSGYDEATVSTANDQLILARTAAQNPTFSAMVATTQYRLPVVGLVHNTDALLGHDGFVGTKTGSDDAAGGCFMFRTMRRVNGRSVDMVGVVLGQRGHSLIAAGLYAARQLADRIAPAA